VPNWIGDAVMSRGFLKALGKKEKSIIVFGKEHLKPLFPEYKFEGISGYRDYYIKLLEYKKIGLKKIYILPPSFSSAFFPFIAGIKERIGFNTDKRGIMLTRSFSEKYLKKEHLLKSFLRLIEEELKKDYMPYFNEKQKKAYKKRIVIAPYASYGKSKEWLYFRELSMYLLNQGFEVIIVGKNKKQSFPDKVKDLSGKTTLKELIEILKTSYWVFTNDSGIAHISSALKKKTFVFFGSTSPLWTKPLGENVYVFYKNLYCSPCFKRKCIYNTYECLKKISLKEVIEIFNVILQNNT